MPDDDPTPQEDDLIGKPLPEVPKIDAGEKCNGRKITKTEGEDEPSIFRGYCKNVAGKGTDHLHEGRCDRHGGASPGAETGNDHAVGNNGGAPEGNRNAWDSGAFSEHFLSDLTETEHNSFIDAANQLKTPEGAKGIGIMAATEAVHKYKRSGDSRFLREFRQICSDFQITPSEEMQHLHAHKHQHEHQADRDLSDGELSALDHVTGGPDEITVEAVEDIEDAEIASHDDETSDDERESAVEVGW